MPHLGFSIDRDFPKAFARKPRSASGHAYGGTRAAVDVDGRHSRIRRRPLLVWLVPVGAAMSGALRRLFYGN